MPLQSESDSTAPETERQVDEDNQLLSGTKADFLAYARAAESTNRMVVNAMLRNAWARGHRAYQSQHPEGSKYTKEGFKARSKIFRPKTRTAVRKNLATTAAALFSTDDVVSVRAEHDDDPVKQASAMLWHEALNYRLDRTSVKSGIPWFLVAIGASFDSQLHGVCVTKQYWDYLSVKRPKQVVGNGPLPHPQTGQTPHYDQMTGQMVMGPVARTVMEDKIIRDRPMAMNIPPENAICDPAAPWFAPVQLSPYWIVRFPLTLDDARAMFVSGSKQPAMPGVARNEEWLKVDESVLRASMADYDAKGVRVARDGTDRYENRTTGTSSNRGGTIVWLCENFIRYQGEDYHFWSVGTRAYVSKVKRTDEAYPEQMGERPYTMGFAAVETHRIYPTAPVEALQPLQAEVNELVNLRLDTMKQANSPLAVVRQGTVFDWKQLQRRADPDATVTVRSMDDIRFERPPDVTRSAYEEMNQLNVDLDDVSGSFSGSSVSTNRQLNETVGGMRLLSGSANSVTEYDLRVWVETWCEPTLRQLVRLEQYYEDDEVVLEVAGRRAMLQERFGINQLTEEDLAAECAVKVNVGIGATDPSQKVAKLGGAMKMLGEMVAFFDRPIKINAEEAIKEIMGSAGYKDGMRFVEMGDPAQGGAPQDPKMALEQVKQKVLEGKLQLQAQKLHLDTKTQQAATALKVADLHMRVADLTLKARDTGHSHKMAEVSHQAGQQQAAAGQRQAAMDTAVGAASAMQQGGQDTGSQDPSAGAGGAPDASGGGDQFGAMFSEMHRDTILVRNDIAQLARQIDQMEQENKATIAGLGALTGHVRNIATRQQPAAPGG